MSKQHCRTLQVERFFGQCRKDEISSDIVAETGNIVAKKGNNVEATFDIVQRIVQLVAFDNVASTLLLVWTGLNRKSLGAFRMAAIPMTLSDLEGHLCCLKPFLVLMSYTPGNAACIIFGRAYAYSPTLLASLQLPTSLVFIGC